MNIEQKLKQEIEHIKGQRHQLLIIPETQGNKSDILQGLNQLSVPIINLSLLLAEELKNIPRQKRPREIGSILRKKIRTYSNEVICLEKIVYLFDPELKQDPLRLLEGLSGNKVIIVFWPGDVQNNMLTYATPEHREFYQKQGYAQHIIHL